MTARRRRVCYLSGTRADFGLMARTLHAIADDQRLSLTVLVTGMHLSAAFGATGSEIEREGFPILARIPVELAPATGATMARALATTLAGAVDALVAGRPDLLLLLGDRGEMLAGALAAIHLGIPIVHVHGGERSGTVDEPVRHAISKLAHVHLVATVDSRDRLIRMGERGDTVHVVGVPGLDGLAELANVDKAALYREAGFDLARPLALFLYHPVLQEAAVAGDEARAILQAAFDAGLQVMALLPNADAGHDGVRSTLQALRQPGRLHVETHIDRPRFVSWMASCDVMLGNSSSGIIEAATFGTPVINVGSRQSGRERNANVVDVPGVPAALRAAIDAALHRPRSEPRNLYGDGLACGRIVEQLATLDLATLSLAKSNAY